MYKKAGIRILGIFLFLVFQPNLHAQNFVTTYAGTGNAGFVNGDTSVASFNRPFGISIDTEGNLFLADSYNNCIRKIGIDGQVSIYAGAGIPGYADGPANEARFNQPINICFDNGGNMYVSDFLNQRIRKISVDLQVTTIAGTGVAGFNNGPVGQAQFNYPRGICVDDSGNIFIGDSWNHRIRKISTNGIVSTWAGGGDTIGVQSIGAYIDAQDTSARFYTPCELTMDENNNIYVADAFNHRIRMINSERLVSTVAGSGGSGPDEGGFMDGNAEEARFNVPTACHIIMDGNIFVGDGSNQRIRKISADGMVTTYAGSGDTGFENGPDSLATFDFPRGTVFDAERGRLYVVDYNNHAVRIVHLEEVTGLIGQPASEGTNVFPNPFIESVTIEYSSTQSQKIQITFTDINGVVVDRIETHRLRGGNKFTWAPKNIQAGIYYYKFHTGDEVVTGKVVKTD